MNSGGVVFFALFNQAGSDVTFPKESAAVIKIASSRMATQSERLGYEFAKWLGVRTPQVVPCQSSIFVTILVVGHNADTSLKMFCWQARVIHNSCTEWLQIKEAAERARDASITEGDEVGEVTCSELLEALELSRCLFLMK